MYYMFTVSRRYLVDKVYGDIIDVKSWIRPCLSPTLRQPPSDAAAVKKRRAKKPPYRSLSSVNCSGESTLASKPIERTAAA
jgi:hypothetical protein